jgi:hypothetical protein
MDWISLIGSGVAVTISALCAALHPARKLSGVPAHIDDHEAAIEALRRDNAALRTRLRALETAAKRQKGTTDAS